MFNLFFVFRLLLDLYDILSQAMILFIPFPDTLHISKLSNHPPHILNINDGKVSPSSFIPFCSFAGNWNLTGQYTDMFSIPVCNIFKETLVDGQLCYKADVDKFREEVDKRKIATEGFVFILDHNENRNVEVGSVNNESRIYIETVGKRYRLYYGVKIFTTPTKTSS